MVKYRTQLFPGYKDGSCYYYIIYYKKIEVVARLSRLPLSEKIGGAEMSVHYIANILEQPLLRSTVDEATKRDDMFSKSFLIYFYKLVREINEGFRLIRNERIFAKRLHLVKDGDSILMTIEWGIPRKLRKAYINKLH